MKSKLEIGEKVQSTYKSRWYGVIIDFTFNSEGDKCFYVVICLDKNGNAMRRRVVRCLHHGYLLSTEKEFELPKDWGL